MRKVSKSLHLRIELPYLCTTCIRYPIFAYTIHLLVFFAVLFLRLFLRLLLCSRGSDSCTCLELAAPDHVAQNVVRLPLFLGTCLSQSCRTRCSLSQGRGLVTI
ncbi:hypothetical protein DL95DRAFT_397684, partial [Leptodontidium sp. 2 PMI_412]